MNQLFYGDNLPILRQRIKDESVDLVYLDPPFNSNRSYNVLFQSKSGDDPSAQIEAFDDTWTWSQDSEEMFEAMVGGGAPAKVADALIAMRKLLGDNDMFAYLVMMAARLVELHRVLKPTGSLYLHCDPVASHYLKVLMDAVFGPECFQNEITWQRTFNHGNVGRNFGKVTDILLFFTKSPTDYTWNQVFAPYSEDYIKNYFRYTDDEGRRFRTVTLRNPSVRPNLHYPYTANNGITYKPHPNGWSCNEKRMREYDDANRLYYPSKPTGALMLKQFLDEKEGVKLQNLWTDIPPIGAKAAERLGYPTQKPLALLERIIAASSNPGDVVLDPFCGCGTTVDAAQKLERRWTGIDITYLSIDLIVKRLTATYGEEVRQTFEVSGVPQEVAAAQALFDRNPFDFERWAVSLANGQPNEKQVGDKGIDGIIRFHLNDKELGEAVVSVKGGRQLTPAMVQSLIGAVAQRGAQLGVFICLGRPTPGMIEVAQKSGTFHYEFGTGRYPRIQILTIADLLAGKKVDMPTPINPYKRAKQASGQMSMLDDV